MSAKIHERLESEGIIGPFELSSRASVMWVLSEITKQKGSLRNWYVDHASVRTLLSDGNLQEAVNQFFEPQSNLWRTNFFLKEPGGTEIKWHHDKHFQDSGADIDFNSLSDHFSILIALTDMDQDQGVLEYIPGSHLDQLGFERDKRPYHLRPTGDHFLEMPEDILSKRKPFPLKKGQFALFHSALLHRSLPSTHHDRRVSMIARLCTQNVTVPVEQCAADEILLFPSLLKNQAISKGESEVSGASDRKVAIVTGGSRGIGAAIAKGLYGQGYHIAILGQNEKRLKQFYHAVWTENGPDILPIVCNVEDAENIELAYNLISQTFGRLDVVFANAGINKPSATVENLQTADFERLLSVNAVGVFNTCKYAIPMLKETGGGNIITLGSGIGHNGGQSNSGYAASKAASWILTKSLAMELKDKGINVNELIPGPVITDMNPNASGGDWKKPEDVVDLALFLAAQGPLGPTGQSLSLMRK